MLKIPISDGSGVLDRYTDFVLPGSGQRTVDIWCPPGYAESLDIRYPVLYMHDGQNILDPALAYGGVDWGIDEAMLRLVHECGLPGAIIVGIWNSGEGRWLDYMPQQPAQLPSVQAAFDQWGRAAGSMVRSDSYLKFLVEELKPFIDTTYRTLPDQPHTLVMGSSMGGLISLYALEQYPHVFGGAGCLSTHWPAGGDPLVDWMGQQLPKPGRHKLYFDYGTATLDALYEPYQRRMDGHLAATGYTRDVDWMTLKFDGAEHNEAAWRARVDLPLRFLLK
ncbi:MAG TPA: alpha/beta hydrolase-fold protein [Anaerolineae bacterium]|nr:alpha/beta hydrolase-fold protein [Anaerolineae bacterium]